MNDFGVQSIDPNITGESSSNYMPCVGLKFDSVEEAFMFYNNYGRKIGFSIRKDYSNKSTKDGLITHSKFVCSKEGQRTTKDEEQRIVKRFRAQTITKCPSHMQVFLDRSDNKYVVRKWNDDHNHHLHLPECTHMMPSQRKVSMTQEIHIDMAEMSGISLKESFELMSRQAGGRESLGFTRLDQKNYLRHKRQRDMEYGEAGGLLDYFHREATSNPSFFYAFQLDVDELITNIFWADPKMIIDYGHFGDVVTFDTTFRTNKEYRPLAVFAGLNHFRETIIFGAALLYDETTLSFQWLFEIFLQAMSGKKPLTIFTDQDQAMSKAISEVMPETFHGLCCWHLMQNALKHLGNLFKDCPDFGKDFNSCIFEYEFEKELDDAWDVLLKRYDLEKNLWMAEKWKIRRKWANVYLKRTFTAGMRSTQLSESVNSVLRNYIQPDHDIPRFLHHFSRFVSDKRYKELESIYHMREKQPDLKIKTPILMQMGKVYTPSIFKKFQHEMERSLCCVVKHSDEFDVESEYIIIMYGYEREYFVTFNFLEEIIACSCQKFEKFGFLCRHALKVLERRDIMQIPEKYILKRWRQDARDGYIADASLSVNHEDPKLVVSTRYKNLCPIVIKLVARCSMNENAYQLVFQTVTNLFKQIEEMCNPKDDTTVDDTSIAYNDPNFSKVKGFKKKVAGYKGWGRLKSWSEKRKKETQVKKMKVAQPSRPPKNTTIQAGGNSGCAM